MATIEELRDRDRTMLASKAIEVFPVHPRPSPDDVVLRVTNETFQDVLWVTADGELHFGARALAGLTRHVIGELFLRRLIATESEVARLNCRSGAEPINTEDIHGWDEAVRRLREKEATRTTPVRNPFEAHKPLE